MRGKCQYRLSCWHCIGYYAFAGCSSLESVDLPDSLEEMYEDVFKDTACIRTEDGIKYVDNWAVGTEKDIETGNIKEGTVGAVGGMFSDRNKLRTISFPASMKHIADGVFVGLGHYTQIDSVDFYNDTIPERSIIGTAVREYIIHDPNCRIADTKTALMPYYIERDESYVPKDDEEKPTEYTLSHNTIRINSANYAANSLQKAINTSLIEIDTDDNTEPETISYVSINRPAVKKAPVKAGTAPKYDTVIRGIKGSTAEDYAIKYRRVFEPFTLRTDLNKPQITDYDNVRYSKYMDTYAIANVRINNGEKIKEITIAPEIDGAPVKEISVSQANADTIHIPATVQLYIHWEDVPEGKVAFYDVDKDNPYLTSVDGIIYSKDMTKLIKVPSGYAGKKIVVPDGVKVIDSYAFFGLENVESVELPDSVETIGKNSFGSRKITSINLPENLDVIGDYAFAGCTGIKDISIPDSVNHIGYNAFLDVCEWYNKTYRIGQ